MMRIPVFFLLLFLVSGFSACIDDEAPPATPKPRGYYRIDMPEKKYTVFNSDCPYEFELPWYSAMRNPQGTRNEPCWYNLDFPGFRATVHLSYKAVHNNIDTLIDNVWELTEKHNTIASGYRDSLIKRPDANVYGLVFELSGNAASQMQFYVTDSTTHFIRGALYFMVKPNKDSLAPSLDFLKKDIYHLIETMHWKDQPAKPAK
jgi:gliding motility-associated lipoprotein GldD